MILVKNTALALMRYIRNPDTPDPKSICFRTHVHLIPERLVEFLSNIYQLSAISHLLDLRSKRPIRSDLTFGNPLACAPMIVTSPGCGFGLSSGMYCFTARESVSSCSLAVAAGYSRIYWLGRTCSTTRKEPLTRDGDEEAIFHGAAIRLVRW